MTAARRRNAWLVAALVLLTLVCLPAAYYSMFGLPPRTYDDEGYFLMSIKLVVAGQRLYDDVASGYGPFYYLVFVPLSHLIGGIDHDSGRLTVLVLWLGGCWLCALAALRLTGSRVLALIAFALCFRTLSTLTNEPMNPAALLNLLLLAAVAVAATRAPRDRTFTALAVLVTLAGLVKINIGIYAAAALLFAVLAGARPRRPWLYWAGGGFLMCVLPLALMARDLGHTKGYLLVVVVSGGAVLAAAAYGTTPAIDLGRALRLVVAAAAVTAVVVLLLAMLVTGATPAGLWEGVVTLASQSRDVFTVFDAVALRPTLLLIPLLPLAARSLRTGRAAVAWGLVRLAGGVAIGLALMLGAPFEMHAFAPVEWGLPLAWLAALPDPRAPDSGMLRFGRVFAAALAVTESLYAYPVAGAQEAFAAVFVIPVAVVCFADGARLAAPLLEGVRASARPAAIATIATLLVVGVAAGNAALPLPRLVDRYDQESRLPVEGATRLHVDTWTLRRVAWLRTHLKRCSTFVPLLGMNSVYLWTDTPPPAFMQQSWPRTLDVERQQAIVDKLGNDPRACLLINFPILKFWSNDRPLPNRPLVQFTRHEFQVAEISPFGDEIWTRKRTG